MLSRCPLLRVRLVHMSKGRLALQTQLPVLRHRWLNSSHRPLEVGLTVPLPWGWACQFPSKDERPHVPLADRLKTLRLAAESLQLGITQTEVLLTDPRPEAPSELKGQVGISFNRPPWNAIAPTRLFAKHKQPLRPQQLRRG